MNDACSERLLLYLSPRDWASLRRVSRAWQASVDRCLGCLFPFAAAPPCGSSGSSLAGVPCLVLRCLFQTGVQVTPLTPAATPCGLAAVAGHFTALHTLAVDATSKRCGDYAALALLPQLRRLQLRQFEFSDDALRDGVAHCSGLQVLQLESQQAMMQLRSLRHLSGLVLLQELSLRPRGYISVPGEAAAGVAALSQLSRLTQLLLVTALKPPRWSAGGPLPELPGPLGAAARPVYFDSAATQQLSSCLAALRQLRVLRVAGIASLPLAISQLTQLRELSLERLGQIDRHGLASLSHLSQLSAVTIVTAASPAEQIGHDAGAAAGGAPAAVGVGAAAAGQQAAGAAAARRCMWLPLLQLPALQELVLGAVQRGQALNLTSTLTCGLQPPGGSYSAAGSAGDGAAAAGAGGCASSGFGSGLAAARYEPREGAAVSAYVCPDTWSRLADVKGLKHVLVEARGWHSAAIAAHFPDLAAAMASLMSWPLHEAAAAAPAAQHIGADGGGRGLLAGLAHMAGLGSGGSGGSGGGSSDGAAASSPRGTHAAAAAGAVGAFVNHPLQGAFLPGLPVQLLVLAMRPSLRQLGHAQQQLLRRYLELQPQPLPPLPLQHGGAALGQQLAAAGGWGMQPQPPESPARCLLLAQLRASVHPTKVLAVLAASAPTLNRLELTIDQSWSPAVLAGLGQLRRLPQLRVLRLDCGRQEPPDEMWQGLACLTGLRWLCLRWLDSVPVSSLKPLTNLRALQLKAISRPPGAAELAEVLAGMPCLAALGIEGALLDADSDWLRDTAGLLRHGRWTSSWVEHTLCRQQRLRVLGSLTAALLWAVALNSPQWPEMLATACLAAAAGAVFVLAVGASLLALLLEQQQLVPPHEQAAAVGAGGAALAAGWMLPRAVWQATLCWLLGSWLWAAAEAACGWAGRCWRWLQAGRRGWQPRAVQAATHSSGTGTNAATGTGQAAPGSAAGPHDAAATAAYSSSSSTSSSSSSRRARVADPGAAFRRLRLLSLRRCTLTHSSNSLSNRLWQLSTLTSRLAPGTRGSQLIALLLGCVLWPLAIGGALSRIVASASSSSWDAPSTGGGRGSGASRGRGRFAAWGWCWDALCGLLQGAANKVEVAAAGRGALVGLAGAMPELRFLDVTWMNLEAWELHALVQLELHYLGLSKQQLAVVMSREALLARACQLGRPPRRPRQQPGAAAAGAPGAGAGSAVDSRGWPGAWLWSRCLWLVWPWNGAAARAPGAQPRPGGTSWERGDEGGSSMLLVEAPSGFDEIVEREIMAAAL